MSFLEKRFFGLEGAFYLFWHNVLFSQSRVSAVFISACCLEQTIRVAYGSRLSRSPSWIESTPLRVCLHIVAPPGVASSQISRRTEEEAVNAWCIPRYGFKKFLFKSFLEFS